MGKQTPPHAINDNRTTTQTHKYTPLSTADMSKKRGPQRGKREGTTAFYSRQRTVEYFEQVAILIGPSPPPLIFLSRPNLSTRSFNASGRTVTWKVPRSLNLTSILAGSLSTSSTDSRSVKENCEREAPTKTDLINTQAGDVARSAVRCFSRPFFKMHVVDAGGLDIEHWEARRERERDREMEKEKR